MSKGLVLLYMPHLAPPEHWNRDYLAVPPLSHLALGAALREAGYEVRLIDAKWEPDARRLVVEAADRALCLGVSCLTGYSVADGLAVAEAAKRRRPDLPVVWGGWHPSFVARQAVADPRVDVVVRGPGERTLVELLDAWRERRSPGTVAGLTYRDGATIAETPDRPAEDLDALPPPAYDLVDVRRYIRVGPDGERRAATIFSRGCPYRCDFCLDSRKKWLGLGLGRVREELEFWVDRWKVDALRFYDGNFFLGRERLLEFARLIGDGPLAGRFRWSATGVASRLVSLDGEVLDRLRRAGCDSVAIGAESGSDELLRQITNKTTVEHTTEAVRRLTRHGINQYLFFMVGFPVEPPEALDETLALIARLKAINPRLELQIAFCIPLPGSRMFEIAVEKGLFPEPRAFADWAQFHFLRPSLPHIGPRYLARVTRFLTYLHLAHPPAGTPLGRVVRHPVGRAALAPLRRLADWRVRHLALGMPVEAAGYRWLRARRREDAMPASRAG
jgi:radical SAM superfamily enzyme YgiQ (UPF0313 family)